MQIHKFGGASIKDANAIKNVSEIIRQMKDDRMVIIISAIGKTTNALEKIVHAYVTNDVSYEVLFDEIISNHKTLIDSLFEKKEDAEFAISGVVKMRTDLNEWMLENPNKEYTFCYDQIVPLGERMSSFIVHRYLRSVDITNEKLDARQVIITDDNYTDANIDWDKTKYKVSTHIHPGSNIYIMEGFIGSTAEGHSTTLGREGSDFSAAIMSYCLDAAKMTVWKDVDGIYNADPKLFPDAIVLKELTYKEAIEMTFYGAQVIHPKTIKPLQNKGIPLHVRSFLQPDKPGTKLVEKINQESFPPIIVLKKEQVLLTFSNRDYSFLNEKNLGRIIQAFGDLSLRILVMQNTAISFLVVTDLKVGKIEFIMKELDKEFSITKTVDLDLLTIRHYYQEITDKYTKGRNVIMAQKTAETIQYLMSS
ncbi:MAG: aspartate kinase [Bacteroidetes bacterium]|nr:aspartate kinase [Bacteroidota bacterium]